METSWTNNNSLTLSRVLVGAFAACLLALDVGGWWLLRWLTAAISGGAGQRDFVTLVVCLYLGSVPAYALLLSMNRLLANLQAGQVFTEGNVKLLRRVSLCCFAGGIICLLGGAQIFSLLFITLAAFFVGLIVRIVENVFRQAISMKDELDFTV